MRIGIALGSNLGDRNRHLRLGRDFLISLHLDTSPPLVSPLYETAPVHCPPGSHPFLNAVVEISTSLTPPQILEHLAAFEQEAGRPARRSRNAPRPLDLDLLYAGDLRLHTPTLTLPHPRLALRRFVLQPLADIRPDLILPGSTRTITRTLADLPAGPEVTLLARDW